MIARNYHGFHAVGIKKIIEEANVATMTLYKTTLHSSVENMLPEESVNDQGGKIVNY